MRLIEIVFRLPNSKSNPQAIHSRSKRVINYWAGAALLLFTLSITACGGGSGGGGSDDGPGDPVIDILFPPQNSLTDAATITVRGTGTSVASVTVNGVAASSNDGFSNWTATVPLVEGANNINTNPVGARDGLAARTTSVTLQRSSNMLYDPQSAELDLANNRILVVDRFLKALFAVDLATGVRTEISGTVGTGNAFVNPRSLALDLGSNRAIVADGISLMAVNLTTGNRSVISDSGTGTGPALPNNPRGMAFDLAGNRALLIDFGNNTLFEIDLTSGNRNIISDDVIGTGPSLNFPLGIAFDAVGGQVFVTSQNARALMAVSLANGNRAVVSDPGTGTGFDFVVPSDVLLDLPGGSAYVVNTEGLDSSGVIHRWASLVQVALANGNRTLVSERSVGSGPEMMVPASLDRDVANNRFLVFDRGRDALIAINDGSGDRSFISAAVIGTGTNFRLVNDIAYDRSNNRAYIVNVDDSSSAIDAVLAVDLTTGDRTVLSGIGTGSGAYNFRSPQAIGLDLAGNRVLVTDIADDVVVGVDLTSGDRTILSGMGTGAGLDFLVATSINFDLLTQRAYTMDTQRDALFFVDDATGDRTILSDAVTGIGNPFVNVRDTALDLANQRALALDESSGVRAVIGVSLANGDRTTISDNGTGSGESFGSLEAITYDSLSARPIVVNRSIFSVVAHHLLSVNPANGDRTILSGTGFDNPGVTGLGPVFGEATKIDADTGLALVYDYFDQGLGALFVVDLVTGERVVVSR